MHLHHVQVAIPEGGEDIASEFWVNVLGFEEIDKPPALATRGGAWFRHGGAEIHCGVEEPFAPAQKAHPAFEVIDLDEVAARLAAVGREVVPDELFPGVRRFYVADPFGNRLEFLSRDS